MKTRLSKHKLLRRNLHRSKEHKALAQAVADHLMAGDTVSAWRLLSAANRSLSVHYRLQKCDGVWFFVQVDRPTGAPCNVTACLHDPAIFAPLAAMLN